MPPAAEAAPTTAEEKAKQAAKEKLAKSNYSLDGEHLCSQEELQGKLATELSQRIAHMENFPELAGWEYTFQAGIKKAQRDALRFDEEGHIKLNQLTPAKQKPEWQKFLEQLTGFFALLLWAGSILCFVGYALRKDIDNLYLGIVLAVVVTITGVFSYMQDAKSASLMEQFSKMRAQKIKCRTDSSFKAKKEGAEPEWILDDGAEFNPVYLVRGDIVELKAGDKVPADIRVLEASDFKIDNSPLTGEPDALERVPQNSIEDEKEAKNIVFYGTDVKNGTCTGVVLRIGDDTFIGKIAQLTEATEVEQTPINKEIHHFIKIVSGVAMFLGVSFFVIGLLLGTDLITNLVFMIGIIVANVPEGLLATVTVCLTLTSKSMASKAVLVKNMEGVETLGSTTCICSDKTGTLTQNKMTFAELLFDGEIFRTEFVEPGPKPYKNIDTAAATFSLFHTAMCLNTTATFKVDDLIDRDATGMPKKQNVNGEECNIPAVPFYDKALVDAIPTINWRTQGDASESSIIKFAQYMYPGVWAKQLPTTKNAINELYNSDLMEKKRHEFPMAPQGQIPFNSANKYHVKITENVGNAEFPYTVWMKGAPERILARCGQMIQGGEVQPLDADSLTNIETKQSELMNKGRRVLAFAKYDIPASMVPAHPARKNIKVPKRNDDGSLVRDRMGEPVMESVETDIPFEMDENVCNFLLGDFEVKKEQFIAQYIAANQDESEEVRNAKVAEMRNSCIKLTFIGMAALIDPPRPSVPDAVLSCQRAGIRVVMVTGDHPDTAAAIAKMVNIFTTDMYKKVEPIGDDGVDSCVTRTTRDGKQLDVSKSRAIVVPGSQITPDTTDEMWKFIFSHDEIVFARTSPAQKLQIVQRFQIMEKDIVAVTGDGVNDAPALKKADIGVAMGIAGTEVSKAAADMILMDDNFASIVNGVEEGRLIFDNLKKSIAYTLSSNIPEIAPFLVFITIQTPLPLSTVLILAIDLGTDMVPAISMAWERAEADIMRRPARDASQDRLVTKKLVSFAYLQIGVIQALAGFFTWFVVMNDYGYAPAILPGNGAYDNWGKQVLFCKYDGGLLYNLAGESQALATNTVDIQSQYDSGYVFWDAGEAGKLVGCDFAAKNFKTESGAPAGFDISDSTTFGDYTGKFEQPTLNSFAAMLHGDYHPYMPWKGVNSVYWKNSWLATNIQQKDSLVPGVGPTVDDALRFAHQPAGFYVVDSMTAPLPTTSGSAVGTDGALKAMKAFDTGDVSHIASNTIASTGGVTVEMKTNMDYMYTSYGVNGGFVQPAAGVCVNSAGGVLSPCTTGAAYLQNSNGQILVNVASRMMQKEALHHAQCAYFVSIVVVQWADLMICKTRWLSIYDQGMINPAMNFGLVFETILAAVLCYLPGFNSALGTRNLRLLHWVPAVPFSIAIMLYDEVRKYLMRKGSKETKQGEQVIMTYGWLGRNTYY
jgi:sodium/potassium-transporting ATPase subunit alpha